ncbi:MAG: glycosyltransferase, partial [Planctomycetota bacterium]
MPNGFDKKKILIVHPEGNINNNPNLTGIVEILCENDCGVDIYSPRRDHIYQHSPCSGSRLILIDGEGLSVEGMFVLSGQSFSTEQQICDYLREKFGDYDLAIGVDRGIIDAALIAQANDIPYGLISYEIFFGQETGSEFKHPVIKACKCLDFAVCQDPVRARYLAVENGISLKEIINIPVAGHQTKEASKSYYLHDKLSIPRDKRIVLYMGTVDKWSGIDKIAQSAINWPQPWVLVLHNRYGMDNPTREYFEKYKDSNKIFFSNDPLSDPNQLGTLLHCADAGIAFYTPTYQSKYTGRNIEHIGMASGKVATYLQHGVPVITNQIGRMSDYIRQYQLGQVVDEPGGFDILLREDQLETLKRNCLDFFRDKLDLNVTINPLLEKIQSLLDSKPKKTMSLDQDCGRTDIWPGIMEFRVSAIVSVYNAEQFIKGCLENLVSQTLYQKDQLEIVVVNTGSDQNEDVIIKDFKQRYDHINYIKTDSRETIYSAWNRGAKAACGKFLANTNTDDRLRNDALEVMANALETDRNIGAVYIDQIITTIPNETFENHHAVEHRRRENFTNELIVQKNPCGPQVMWTREMHEHIGYFRPDYEVAGDWDFWNRIEQETDYTIRHIPQLLGLYYANPNGLEIGPRKQKQRLREIEEIKAKYNKRELHLEDPATKTVAGRAKVLLTTCAAPAQAPFSTKEKRPPIGIGFLISVLRDAGHEVFFIDNYLEPNDFLETDYLQSNGIGFVGIYLNTICLRDGLRMIYALEQLRQTKQWNGKIIVGGPHTTVAPQTIPDFVDFVVQGEGERAILDIVEGKVTDRIVCYPRIETLDELPAPAWDYFVNQPYQWDVDFFAEKPVFTMNTSRGCPFKCQFCSVGSIWGKRYTYFSAERIVSDIEHLIKYYGARGIYFREDNFTINKNRLEKFCHLLIDKGINIPWACETRVSNLDRDIVALMARAGARGFYFGVESGSQRILDLLQKDITVEQIRDAFKWCHEFGIETVASTIVGVPGETQSDRHATDRLLKEIRPTLSWSNIFVGIPDSSLYRSTVKDRLYEYIDDRGLVYLQGHNSMVERYYGNNRLMGIPDNEADKDMTNKPKISVLMAVYNGQEYVEQALESIYSQSYQDFEVVIVDDASTDSTPEILLKMKDNRTVIYRNAQNLGLTKSLNIGLKLCRGQLIARMDADDISRVHRFEKQVEFFEQDPNCIVVGCWCERIDAKGIKCGTYDDRPTEHADMKQQLLKGNCIAHGTAMIRRPALLEVGGYNEKYSCAQDHDLWLRLSEIGQIRNMEEYLYELRAWPGNITASKEKVQYQYSDLAIQEALSRRSGREKIFSQESKHRTFSTETNWRPRFSIVMANYNNSKYIAEAIESIRCQLFEDWELIIIDDCSTDNSLAVVTEYLTDERIRLIRHESNRGYISALKSGIAEARSQFFGILDSDDCLVPNAVEIMYSAHVKYPDCGLIYSQHVVCDENLTPMRTGGCGNIPDGMTNLETDLVSAFRTFKLCDYLKTSGYDQSMHYAEDKDIAYKMEEVTKLKFVNELLYLYRHLQDSNSHHPRKMRLGQESMEVAKKTAHRRRNSLSEKGSQSIELTRQIPSKYKIAMAVLAHERPEYLEICLNSLFETRLYDYDITFLLQDDGSSDPRVREIIEKQRDPKYKIVRYFTDKGHNSWGGAFNKAMRKLLDIDDFDIIGSCDSDAMFHPEWLDQTMKVCLWAKANHKEHSLGPFSSFNSSDYKFHKILGTGRSPHGDYVVKERMGALNYFYFRDDLLKLGFFAEHEDDETLMTEKFKALGVRNFCTKTSYVEHIGQYSVLGQWRPRFNIFGAFAMNLAKGDWPSNLSTEHGVTSDIPIDVLIPFEHCNIDNLDLVVKSVRQNLRHPIGQIILVGPSSDKVDAVCSETGCRFVSEDNIFKFNKTKITHIVNGQDRSAWLFAQLVKLAGDSICTQDHFLVLNGDTVLTRPQVFELEGKTLLLHTEDHHHGYFGLYKELFGIEASTPLPFSSPHMLFNKVQ